MRKVITPSYMALLIGAGFSLCVSACAGAPSMPVGVSSAAKRPPAGCVSQTGTRISLGPTECAAAGHIWTEDAIKSTGATEPGEALRLLDPTATIQGR
jgi:hypothetical protein